MAVKTITIDMDAYNALRRHKRDGQSFSAVIKEHFGGGRTGRALKEALTGVGLSDTTIDAIDGLIDDRKTDEPRAPAL